MTARRVALAALVLLLWAGAWVAIGRLDDARTRLASARAAPPPRALALPADAWTSGPDALAARITRAAAARRLMVERLAPRPAPPGLAGIDLVLSGPEPALVALVAEVEAARPIVRLSHWRLERAAGTGAVRLTARAVAPWR